MQDLLVTLEVQELALIQEQLVMLVLMVPPAILAQQAREQRVATQEVLVQPAT